MFYTGEKKNDFADVDLSQKIPSKVDAENFNLLLAHTHAGNVSVAELVDGMYSLEENLPPHVTDKLFKFLGKDTILTVSRHHSLPKAPSNCRQSEKSFSSISDVVATAHGPLS